MKSIDERLDIVERKLAYIQGSMYVLIVLVVGIVVKLVI